MRKRFNEQVTRDFVSEVACFFENIQDSCKKVKLLYSDIDCYRYGG